MALSLEAYAHRDSDVLYSVHAKTAMQNFSAFMAIRTVHIMQGAWRSIRKVQTMAVIHGVLQVSLWWTDCIGDCFLCAITALYGSYVNGVKKLHFEFWQ
jgi:hypothetical protein